jgi:hypothetical protein
MTYPRSQEDKRTRKPRRAQNEAVFPRRAANVILSLKRALKRVIIIA